MTKQKGVILLMLLSAIALVGALVCQACIGSSSIDLLGMAASAVLIVLGIGLATIDPSNGTSSS